jgi:tetratricopeptide (TPR) repeat protein
MNWGKGSPVFIFILFFLLFLPYFIGAHNIDSLKLALKNSTSDTVKCNILALLAENEPDEKLWPLYNEQVKVKCEDFLKNPGAADPLRKFYQKHLGAAWNNIGYLANISGRYDTALVYYLKSVKMMETVGDKKGEADILFNIGDGYQRKGEIPAAIQYYFKCLKRREEIRDEIGIATVLNNLGFTYRNMGDLSTAAMFYDKSFKIYEKLGDAGGTMIALGNVGTLLANQGDVGKAMEKFNQCLKIAESVNDIRSIAHYYVHIGVIFYGQHENKKALGYYFKALDIQRQLNDKREYGLTLNNIGAVYREFGEELILAPNEKKAKTGNALAIDFIKESLKIREEVNDLVGLGEAYCNIAVLYQRLGDPSITDSKERSLQVGQTLALEYLFRSLKIREKIKDKKGLANTLIGLASAILKAGKVAQAKEYAEQSLKLSEELGFPNYIRDASIGLANIYGREKNWKKAYQMHKLFKLMSDSLTSIAGKKNSLQKEFQFQFEKKTLADSLRTNEERKIFAAEVEEERIKRWSLYLGLILTAIFSVFILRRFRRSQKQKATIEEQKKEVDDAYSELNIRNKEILDSIHYAKRIQTSLLPSERAIDNVFNRRKNT